MKPKQTCEFTKLMPHYDLISLKNKQTNKLETTPTFDILTKVCTSRSVSESTNQLIHFFCVYHFDTIPRKVHIAKLSNSSGA